MIVNKYYKSPQAILGAANIQIILQIAKTNDYL
jgi:hypothetical protein